MLGKPPKHKLSRELKLVSKNSPKQLKIQIINKKRRGRFILSNFIKGGPLNLDFSEF